MPRTRRTATSATKRFDADYYRRFYDDPATRVADAASVRTLAGFVAAYLRHLDIDVRSVLDVGCGHGHWRTAAAALWPAATYRGVEWSEHLCERFGWTHGSVADFDPEQAFGRANFDLVVCQGVLQYLDDRQAARAIAEPRPLVRRGALPRSADRNRLAENCDRQRTDGDVHLRPGAFYRRRLARDFLTAGGGVFVAKRAGATLFELEGL
jgi:SAM-dependent methyltransferase